MLNPQLPDRLDRTDVGRLLAMAAAGMVLILVWVFDNANPYAATTIRPSPFSLIQATTAVIALVAATKRWPIVLAITALLAFLPMGIYVLLTPGIFMLVGWANILYFVSALLMSFSERVDDR